MLDRSRVGVLVAAALVAAPAAAPSAQVPPGHGVRFSSTHPSPTGEGLLLVDPTSGAVTPVADLSADARQAFSGTLDPSNGRLIVGGGGTLSAAGELRTVRLTGAESSGETVIADLGDQSLLDVALDRDGNVVVLEGGRLLVVSRQTAQVTVWDIDQYDGDFSALEVDPATNRCWVATTTNTAFEDNVLLEYQLDIGPGPGAPITGLLFAGHMGMPGALAFDGGLHLYMGGSDFFGAPSLLRVTFPGGTIDTPTTPPLNTFIAGVWVDRRDGTVHFVDSMPTQFTPQWWVLDPQIGVPAPVAGFPPSPESASALALNDLIDLTTAFPRRPSSAAQTLFEMAAHGLPGEVGLLAVTEVGGAPIAPLILGAGLMNSGGFFTLAFAVPPGLLPAGVSFTVLGARKPSSAAPWIFGSEAEIVVAP